MNLAKRYQNFRTARQNKIQTASFNNAMTRVKKPRAVVADVITSTVGDASSESQTVSQQQTPYLSAKRPRPDLTEKWRKDKRNGLCRIHHLPEADRFGSAISVSWSPEVDKVGNQKSEDCTKADDSGGMQSTKAEHYDFQLYMDGIPLSAKKAGFQLSSWWD